jgi:nitrile hydratase accessory protein
LSPSEPLFGPLKRRDGEPAFDEAWQAQALAMADLMVRAGVVSADAWAQALGEKLRESAEAGDADDTEAYYQAVLSALEDLLASAGAASFQEVGTREEEWRRAYLNTPHGKPVELSAGQGSQSEDHRDGVGRPLPD